MSAEDDILNWLQDTLLMNVSGIGPNVFAYNIERITPEILPCIVITHDSSQATEASTLKNNMKRVNFNLQISVINKTTFYNTKTLYDIRKSISFVLEMATLPASVLDFDETSAGDLEANRETEYPLLTQSVTYSFLTKENDY